MNEYKLIITVTIKEKDDPAARKEALDITKSISEGLPNLETKLQQVYPDRPPRGVRIS